MKIAGEVMRFVVGPLRTNTYVVVCIDGSALVIDPGPGAFYRITYLVDRNLVKPKYILVTHAHFDNAADAEDLREALGAKLIMSIHEFPVFKTSRTLARIFNIRWRDPLPDIPLYKDTTLKLCNYTALFLHTPGHTPGSLSIYFPELNLAFTGDLLLSSGVVGTEDRDKALLSINKLVQIIPRSTKILPCRGPPAILSEVLSRLSL